MPVIVSVKLESSPPNASDSPSLTGDANPGSPSGGSTGAGVAGAAGFVAADLVLSLLAGAGLASRAGFAAAAGWVLGADFGFGLAAGAFCAGAADDAAILNAESGASRWCFTEASTARRARPGDTGLSRNR